MKLFKTWWAAAAIALSLTACGGSDGGGTITPAPQGIASLSGTVINAADNTPMADVAITAGGVSTKSASDGSFSLSNLAAADRLIINATASGFAPATAITQTRAEAAASVRIVLTPVGISTSVAIDTGGTFSIPNSTAQVQLPANGLVDASGAPVTGTASLQLTAIDPARDPAAMPGDYLAQAAAPGAAPSPIESFGAIKVDLKDSAGQPLNLAPNQTAIIRIPVATRSTDVPATIPLYYFNPSSGLWIEEGSAALKGEGSGRYYEGSVKHFTFWNADRPQETIYVRGCLQDSNNQPVPYAIVTSEGNDYTGSASTSADANGQFTQAMRRGGVASVYSAGALLKLLSDVVKVGPSQTDIKLAECLRLSPTGERVVPVLIVQPQSTTATLNAYGFFSVRALGLPVPTYQWRRNGLNISGANSAYISVPAALTENGAVFSVVVTNDAGSVTSDSATLTVQSSSTGPVISGTPYINTQPKAQSVLVGQTATFSVGSLGGVTYQWRRNGQDIAGATAATYTTAATSLADNGAVFTVALINAEGTTVSNSASLTVSAAIIAPAIITQPQSVTARELFPVTFKVVASGTGPLTYQWRRNGIPIDGNTGGLSFPAGKGSDSLLVAVSPGAQSGATIDVVVSNAAGSVTSSGAVLTVTTMASFLAVDELAFIGEKFKSLADANTILQKNDQLGGRNLVDPASICPKGGSVAATLNGVAIVPGAQIPLGANTLAATFNSCASYGTLVGTSSTLSNVTGTGSGTNYTRSNNAIATMTNMRQSGTGLDRTGNGSVTIVETRSRAGDIKTLVQNITPMPGATLRNNLTNQVITAVSGSSGVEYIDRGGDVDESIDYNKVETANAITYTIGADTFVTQGRITENDSAATGLNKSGAITISKNGVQIARYFYDPLGIPQVEITGVLPNLPSQQLATTAVAGQYKAQPLGIEAFQSRRTKAFGQ